VVGILFGLYALLVPGLAMVTLILAFGVGILLEAFSASWPQCGCTTTTSDSPRAWPPSP